MDFLSVGTGLRVLTDAVAPLMLKTSMGSVSAGTTVQAFDTKLSLNEKKGYVHTCIHDCTMDTYVRKDSACPYTHIRLLSEDWSSDAVQGGKASLNEPFKRQVWCMLYRTNSYTSKLTYLTYCTSTLSYDTL